MPTLTYEIDGRRAVFPLTADVVTIGRSADNDLVLGDLRVSRRHARLERVGLGWRVTDLGSSNGTWLNDGARVDRDLRHGDRIRLHQFELTFVDDLSLAVDLTSTAAEFANALPGGTLIRSAVDFSSLAAEARRDRAPGTDRDAPARIVGIVTRASQALLASTSLDETLAAVVELVFEHLPVERGCILLWDPVRNEFNAQAVRERGALGAERAIRFSRTIAERVVRDRVSILTTDATADERFAGGQSIAELQIRSAMAAPLAAGPRVWGLIYGDTRLRAQAFDAFDLDVLSALANHAAIAIERSRLQAALLDQELARRALERYHSPAVVQHITALRGSGEEARATELEVSVLFADVVGFTERSERLEPREVAELLNRYFGEMTEVIFRHEGTLDKFIGDGLMAVFGAPLPAADHARRAVRAALEMRLTLAGLNAPLAPEGRLEFRIGIHSGRVVAGDIGSPRRSDYTVLGATVNLASRIESQVAAPGQIVLSEATRRSAGAGLLLRPLGAFRPKGLSADVECFELWGLADEPAGGPQGST